MKDGSVQNQNEIKFGFMFMYSAEKNRKGGLFSPVRFCSLP